MNSSFLVLHSFFWNNTSRFSSWTFCTVCADWGFFRAHEYFVTKQFFFFGFAITGGNALYGSLFLATDLIGEHYGKRESLQAVGIGFLHHFFCHLLTSASCLYAK